MGWNIIDNLKNWIKSSILNILKSISGFFSWIWNGIKGFIIDFIKSWSWLVNKIADIATNIAYKIASGLVNALSVTVSTISNTVKGLVNTVSNIGYKLSKITNNVSSILSKWILTAWSSFNKFSSWVVSKIWDTLSNSLSKLGDLIITLLTGWIKVISDNLYTGAKSGRDIVISKTMKERMK